MIFDYRSFVTALADREERIREKNTHAIDKKQLFAQDATVFQQLYPEYSEVFAKPHRRAYYHKEAADAIGHLGRFSTVMIRLPPFKNIRDFIEYFGAGPHVIAEYIINGRFLPFIANPRLYQDDEVRDVYYPIFQRISLADSQAIPVYENRLEDALVRTRYQLESWEDFVTEKSREIESRLHIDKVTVGRLVYEDVAKFFSERIAYPELFGISEIATAIRSMMSWDVEKAAMVAYTSDFLITGPITKDRKAQPICVWDFDLNYFRDTALALIQYKQLRRSSKDFAYLATNIARIFKGIRVSRRELKQEPDTPQFIARTEKAKYKLLDIIQEKELGWYIDHCSDLRGDFVNSIKEGNIGDVVRCEQLYFDYQREFREICKGAILPAKNLTLKLVKVATGPAMGLTAFLVHHYYPEMGHVLMELIPETLPEIQSLTEEFLPLVWDSLQEKLYPIVGYDYVPTFNFWAVPLLPSPA